MTDGARHPEAQATAPELAPAQLEYLRQRLEAEQNLPLALLAGAGASLAGAAVWAGVTVVSGYQIGFMAIGIGFLVGFAVRSLGKGVTNTFGVVGAFWSLFGCALGNLLAITAVVARQQGVAFGAALARLDAELIQQLMIAFFSPMDLLFYLIALYYGYRLAFRRLTATQLEQMLSGGAAAPGHR
jgi:hypothetical protein